MDKIYRCAESTIVATGPNKQYGLLGVGSDRTPSRKVFHLAERDVVYTGSDPSDIFQNSTLMERAWTFQGGILSKRLLVFTDDQMSFYCDITSWMESLGSLEHIDDPSTIAWDDWNTRVLPLRDSDEDPPSTSPRTIRRYREFIDLATRYTARLLRYDSDALNAFSGVMRSLQA